MRTVCWAVLVGWVAFGARAGEVEKTVALTPVEIQVFSEQPEEVQALLKEALALCAMGLEYKYGSADPAKGGMDCSGAMFYLLRKAGVEGVPRSSHLQYKWAWEKGRLYPVVGVTQESFELKELKELKPGDLLFWTGTYEVDREPAISPVMLYLGVEEATGKRVMVGASSGRSYAGKARHGVSVFDFKLPSGRGKNVGARVARFAGYGLVPWLINE